MILSKKISLDAQVYLKCRVLAELDENLRDITALFTGEISTEATQPAGKKRQHHSASVWMTPQRRFKRVR
jgi:hypothetical protein